MKRPVTNLLKRIPILIVAAAAAAVIIWALSRPAGTPALRPAANELSTRQILRDFSSYSTVADYQRIIDRANELLQDPALRDNRPLRLFCLAHAAQCYIKTDWPEKAREYLDSAARLLRELPAPMYGDSLCMEGFYTYSNAMILRCVYNEIDYGEAIRHAAVALDSANRRGDIRQSILFGINYAILNTHVQESYAYGNAEELYDKAVKLHDERLIFQTSQLCAWRFGLTGDHDKARKYMETAVTHLPAGYLDASTVYADYADYANACSRTGRKELAEHYFREAIRDAGVSNSSSALDVYLSYAEFLHENGETRRAEQLLRQGLARADSIGTRWNRKSIYHELYRLLKEENRLAEATTMMDAYIREADSIAGARQRKELIELRVRYETAVKERIIEKNERMIAQQRQKIGMIAAAVFVCLAVCVLLLVLYFHKRASYRALFRLYSDLLARRPDPTGENPGAGRNREKADTLFDRIEKAMREEHIYRESGLTVEKAAAMIGTNRTYLSAAIKQNTGLSFIYYVNSYRIHEAMDTLSDPANDTPLKAIILDVGFRSPTTFYKLFAEATGKTPQTWRQEARNDANTLQKPQL